jgi:hypothetical protein
VTGYEQAAVKVAAKNTLKSETTVATVAEKASEKWII